MKGGPGPWMQWYPEDFERDTRALSPASCGIWVRCLNAMHRSKERGVLAFQEDVFCRIGGCSTEQFKVFLHEAKQLDLCEVSVTSDCQVTLKCRRMLREENARINHNIRATRYRKNKHGDAEVTPKVTVQKPEAKKPEAKKKTTEPPLSPTGGPLPADPLLILISEQAPFKSIGFKPDEKTEKWIASIRKTYPRVDLEHEILKAASWCLGNPGHGPKKSATRFLGTWISRANERRYETAQLPGTSGTSGTIELGEWYVDGDGNKVLTLIRLNGRDVKFQNEAGEDHLMSYSEFLAKYTRKK